MQLNGYIQKPLEDKRSKVDSGHACNGIEYLDTRKLQLCPISDRYPINALNQHIEQFPPRFGGECQVSHTGALVLVGYLYPKPRAEQRSPVE